MEVSEQTRARMEVWQKVFHDPYYDRFPQHIQWKWQRTLYEVGLRNDPYENLRGDPVWERIQKEPDILAFESMINRTMTEQEYTSLRKEIEKEEK